MINWRYHFMSVFAVFLALGLGVIIGVGLGESGTIDLGQQGLVDDIRRDIDGMREENNALSTERSINLRYQDNTYPYLVAGQLQGKKVALVAASSVSEDDRRNIAGAIESAGGQVVSSTVLNSRFSPADVVTRSAETLEKYPQLAAIDEATLAAVMGKQLALEVAAVNPPVALSALQGVLVDSAGGNYELTVDAVILLTRADNEYSSRYSELERELILSLKDAGVIIVGGEPVDAPISEVPLFIAAGIPSVDNIGSRIGQLSVVYALAGERDTYGVKPTSDLLIPIMRIPTQGGEPAVEAD
ncbi:MAG: copper transporter [Thermoleophilia bacterium]